MVTYSDLMGFNGIYLLVMANIAMENDHRNSGYIPIENGGSFHSYVELPEGKRAGSW